MPFSHNSPAAKQISELTADEVFRFGDNRLGLALRNSREGNPHVPWSYIVDLFSFEVTAFGTGFLDTPNDFVFSLGNDWIIQTGGASVECYASKAPRSGMLLSDRRGLWLVVAQDNKPMLIGLAGEAIGRAIEAKNIAGMLFEVWSLSSAADPHLALHMSAEPVRA